MRSLTWLPVLGVLAAACGEATPQKAAPETASSERAAASANPSASASAVPTVEGAPAASGSAEAAEAIAPSAVPSAVAAASAEGSAKPKAPPKSHLPRAPKGILPDGVADKLLKTGDPPAVKVLEVGEEPRGVLRYGVAKGATKKLDLAVDLGVSVRSGSQSQAQKVPRITLLMELAALSTNPEGDVEVGSKMSHLRIDAAPGGDAAEVAAMRKQMEGFKGFGATFWATPFGRVRDVKTDLGESQEGMQQIAAMMAQSFDGLVAKLPREAVGAGAQWLVTSRVKAGGADVMQFETFTLKEQSGTKLKLTQSITQFAATAALELPAGTDVKGHIVSFSTTGSGESEIDLKAIGPSSGRVQVKTVITTALEGAGADPATTETSVKFRYLPPKP